MTWSTILSFLDSTNTPAWIQAIASVLAAIGLVWTLILQTKATRAQVRATEEQSIINRDQASLNLQQKELNRLAMEKDRREVRPIFKAIWNNTGKGKSFAVTLSNATAYNVSIEKVGDTAYTTFPSGMRFGIWEVDSVHSFTVDGHEEFAEDTPSPAILTITFMDESLRNYTQSVIYNEYRAWTSLPELSVLETNS